jgi:predicted O-linked N-acetylglucosamine transferase (SPINDLY family)
MNDFLLQNAWRLHQAGDLAEAARLYQDILRTNPRHLGALQLLGFLHFQREEFEEAEKIMARALKIEPKAVDALYNRGCALQALERHKEALQCFDKALDLKRDYAPAHLNRGNSLFRLGRHREALACYDRAIAINPAYAEALLNRANALLELKRADEALANYERAIAIDPRQAILWNNRGNALAELGRHAEALPSYEKAIALQPGYADAFENRGDTLERLNRDMEALDDYRRTLALDPSNAGAHHKCARLLAKLNRPQEALLAFEAVLALDSRDVPALIGKGVILENLERYEDALAAFDRALTLDPKNADALSNRANTLIAMKRFTDALSASEKALASEPLHAAALHNRGSALSGLRRHADAIASFDKALAAAPENAASWNGRGGAELGLKHYDEALRNFDTALALNPAKADVLANRAAALSKLKRFGEAAASANRALFFQPDHEAAMRERAHARLSSCDWRAIAGEKAEITAALAAGRRAVHPFDALAISDSEAANRIAATLCAEREYPAQPPLWRGERYSHEKIRLAYLSTDFRAHAVGFLIVGALELHDKAHFETTALSIGADDKSEVRERIASTFDRFIDARDRSDYETAALLRDLEIDIVIDLNGYTGDARTGIMAHRAAPIQVNYLGYPGTMGAPYIDYIIADRVVIPEIARGDYSEAVVYLPDTYQANDSKRRVSEKIFTRSEAGLPEQGFVFCSLSSSYKFAPGMFEVWMRLLHAVEGSVLWLLQDNPEARVNLKREAEARGVAAERLIFAPHVPPDEHLARQPLAGLFLDTLPYNAHTTASDALWMGLPVVTCTGTTFPGRVATSILHAAGLPELVTASLTDYEALARKLAMDPDALGAVKTKLASLRGHWALFDTARFTRHLEAAYREMWQRHMNGAPRESFAVTAGPR